MRPRLLSPEYNPKRIPPLIVAWRERLALRNAKRAQFRADLEAARERRLAGGRSVIPELLEICLRRRLSDDATQQLVLRALEGRLNMDEVRKPGFWSDGGVGRKRRDLSMDAPIAGTDGLVLGDTL